MQIHFKPVIKRVLNKVCVTRHSSNMCYTKIRSSEPKFSSFAESIWQTISFIFDVWTCMVRYFKFREIVIQSFRLQLTNQSLLLLLYSFLFQSSLFTFPFSKFLPSISPILLHIMFEETVWNK